jgi:hypothetical protein
MTHRAGCPVRRQAVARHGGWHSVTRFVVLTCLLLGSAALGAAGCGSSILFAGDSLYPNALRGDSGEEIHRATLESIVNDDDLTEAEKRQALEALGIEDEDIQEYLLTNF